MESNKVKKILIVHPFFKILGGAELVALRIIAILLKKYRYEVTILTYDDFRIEKLNDYSNLSLPAKAVNICEVKLPIFLKFTGSKLYSMKIAYLHRIAKRISHNYDICISTYNEIDFGKKGIQYIHHPNFACKSLLSKFNIMNSENPNHRRPYLDYIYKIFLRLIAGHSKKGFKENITLVNSSFMGNIIEMLYDIKPRVVYPCVVSLPTKSFYDWEERLFQFISVGRISPDKNFIELINTFLVIANKFPFAKFIIAGKINNYDYYMQLCDKIDKLENIDIKILTDIEDNERNRLYQESKFYIHSKPFEHFGISILEAASAGCLTFVHDSGGMKEIVKTNILRYSDTEDLLDKITKIIDDKNLRNKTLANLKTSISDFSVDKFDEGFESAINDLIKECNL